jgi:hypothetical protein
MGLNFRVFKTTYGFKFFTSWCLKFKITLELVLKKRSLILQYFRKLHVITVVAGFFAKDFVTQLSVLRSYGHWWLFGSTGTFVTELAAF